MLLLFIYTFFFDIFVDDDYYLLPKFGLRPYRSVGEKQNQCMNISNDNAIVEIPSSFYFIKFDVFIS